MAVNTPRKRESAISKPAAMPTGQAVAGEAVTLDDPLGASAQLPALPPSPVFFLAVHPDSWAVRFDEDGEPVLLPSLRKLQAQPGVNGVESRQGPDGSNVNWRPAAARAADRGWTVIPHAAGPGGTSYLRRIQVTGGDAHITCFDRCYAGSDVVECDRQGLSAWIGDLLKSGKIPGPSLVALRRQRDAVARQQLEAASKAAHSPIAAERAARLTKVIGLLEMQIKATRGPQVAVLDAPVEDL